MNEWEILATVLAAAVVPCIALCLLADIGDALVALELAGTLASTALMALAEGLGRQPFIDLALVLAVLSLLGCLLFARLLEQDL